MKPTRVANALRVETELAAPRRALRFALLAVACLIADHAQAASIFEEPFSYAAGDLTTVSAANWTAHSGGGTGPVQVIHSTSDAGSSLAYPGLAASAGSRIVIDGANAEDVNRGPGSTLPETIYASFLAKVTALPGASNTYYFAHYMKSSNTFRGRVFVRAQSGSVQFGLAASATSAVGWSGNLPLNATHLLVLRFNGATGTADLWVNPSAGSFGAGSPPLPTLTDTGVALSGLVAFAFRQSSGIGTVELDELRLGPSWADVTPSSASVSVWREYGE